MTLGSTQPLTEMSTRNLPGDKGRPARKTDLTAICEPIVWKNVGASTSHNPMGLNGLTGIALLLRNVHSLPIRDEIPVPCQMGSFPKLYEDACA
jgi:hypothetical protein